MKKFMFLLSGILALAMISCKGQSNKSDSATENPAKKTTVSPVNNQVTKSSSVPTHLTKAEFLKLVMDYEKNPDVWSFQGEKPCLIDFYADWCAPCRITSPILEELAVEFAGKINIYKVNVDKEKELASVFGVQSIPTFLFCPLNGNPTISSGIANSREATKDMFIQQIKEILLKQAGSSEI